MEPRIALSSTNFFTSFFNSIFGKSSTSSSSTPHYTPAQIAAFKAHRHAEQVARQERIAAFRAAHQHP
jgi:hypothetical protein